MLELIAGICLVFVAVMFVPVILGAATVIVPILYAILSHPAANLHLLGIAFCFFVIWRCV